MDTFNKIGIVMSVVAASLIFTMIWAVVKLVTWVIK